MYHFFSVIHTDYKMGPVRRIAQIVHLKPSAVAAYKECHANVWPEVLQQIKDCNVKDCTFFTLKMGTWISANVIS
jgi:L-rhamnose mutarotase